MGNIGKENSQVDSNYYENISFHLNILVCGDYKEENMEKDLEKFQIAENYKNLPYIKESSHLNIPSWKYFLFNKDSKIGDNTFNFIFQSIAKKDSDTNNVILFYSGLKDYTYNDLIQYYDKKAEIYHPNIIIVTNKENSFSLPRLKKLNENFIRVSNENDSIGILIHLIELSSFYNQLGDEIGFPKKFVNEELLKKDNKLIIKDSFTFNILVCGKPGAGKSTLINKILGKKKSFTGRTSSLTQRVIKYIHDKYPILLYDTPGFEHEDDIIRIQKLIIDKNNTLNEEKNRIHCILYVMNTKAERTFIKNEYPFLVNLLNQKMDIFFIATHAEKKENALDYIEATKVNLQQNSGNDNRIINLKQYIYPVELNNIEHYKQFGLKEVFEALYNKYEKEKFEEKITPENLNKIKSSFLGEINSKENLKKRLIAQSERVKANFKLLASSLGMNPTVKGTTMLSTAVIRIISKIYNQNITIDKCLSFIESHNYTNELRKSDTTERLIQKTFASIFYVNGPAAKEVDYIAECLIEKYNEELNNNDIFFKYLNSYNEGINYAIDCLRNITDSNNKEDK